ncbi:hypothetical protein [Tengunoibacter tsumagoiensis]|uniref:Uncharacterized protein n=1 Tax=Tengunoibacter tsumagoiensis TaxID=2014871 RepID=A0A402A2I5_9CHLR|nr:hypothetical protein [Tengunoibacter tsumagoiensis]GCE13357.1 hypothetical protein KTT_32160 [Tengunoibacter tsumagoiensis]
MKILSEVFLFLLFAFNILSIVCLYIIANIKKDVERKILYFYESIILLILIFSTILIERLESVSIPLLLFLAIDSLLICLSCWLASFSSVKLKGAKQTNYAMIFIYLFGMLALSQALNNIIIFFKIVTNFDHGWLLIIIYLVVFSVNLIPIAIFYNLYNKN